MQYENIYNDMYLSVFNTKYYTRKSCTHLITFNKILFDNLPTEKKLKIINRKIHEYNFGLWHIYNEEFITTNNITHDELIESNKISRTTWLKK